MRGFQVHARAPRLLAAAAMRDDLADHMAEGGTLVGYSRNTGMTERGVQKAWKAIRDGLGSQAV